MATFPDYACLKLAGAGQDHASVVQRSEVERGIPRTRRTASDALVTQSGSIIFTRLEDVNSFEAWFYSAVGANAGMAWFDWYDARIDAIRSARIVPPLGALVPVTADYGVAEWPCKIEWVRSAY